MNNYFGIDRIPVCTGSGMYRLHCMTTPDTGCVGGATQQLWQIMELVKASKWSRYSSSKAKWQYLLTFQVSRHCHLALNGTIVHAVHCFAFASISCILTTALARTLYYILLQWLSKHVFGPCYFWPILWNLIIISYDQERSRKRHCFIYIGCRPYLIYYQSFMFWAWSNCRLCSGLYTTRRAETSYTDSTTFSWYDFTPAVTSVCYYYYLLLSSCMHTI